MMDAVEQFLARFGLKLNHKNVKVLIICHKKYRVFSVMAPHCMKIEIMAPQNTVETQLQNYWCCVGVVDF